MAVLPTDFVANDAGHVDAHNATDTQVNANTALLATALQAGANLSDLDDASSARTALGLGDVATHAADEFDAAGAAAAAAAASLPLSGGTLTGALVLAADPGADLQAATKRYVDAHGLSGTLTLTQAAPGTSFDVVYDGTDWQYAGTTVTARPSSRIDLVMQCVNPIDTTTPSWAIAGDLLLRVS